LDDSRFTVPLYTAAEAARFLGVHPSTFSTWAKGYVRRPPGRREVTGAPIVTSFAAQPRYPTVPFVGLAEGMVVAAFRKAGVSLQHIRRAVAVLEREIAVEHALASRRLYTDGAVILFDYARSENDDELTVVVTQQRVFSPVVEEYLQRIEHGIDGWAIRVASPVTARPVVLVDPRRAFGQPIFVHGAAPVESIVDRIRAGEPIADVAVDFGVPEVDVRDYLDAAVPVAA
jgi:uncharacterized protein (DUF433 family)